MTSSNEGKTRVVIVMGALNQPISPSRTETPKTMANTGSRVARNERNAIQRTTIMQRRLRGRNLTRSERIMSVDLTRI